MLQQPHFSLPCRSPLSRESFLRGSDLALFPFFRVFFVFLATFTINSVEFSNFFLEFFRAKTGSVPEIELSKRVVWI